MSYMLWVIGVAVALLSALNAIFWGYCVREVGDPSLSPSFLFKLMFNKWFILAMASAFVVSLLSYVVLRKIGILAGRFFLTLQLVAVILASTLILGERPSIRVWMGVTLVVAGVSIIGLEK